jgi:hypothetical protein
MPPAAAPTAPSAPVAPSTPPPAPAPAAPPAPPRSAPGPAPRPPSTPPPQAPDRSDASPEFETALSAAFDKYAPLDKKPDEQPGTSAPPAGSNPPAAGQPEKPIKEAPKPADTSKPTAPTTPPPNPRDPKELRAELAAKSKQLADYEERLKSTEAKAKDAEALAARIAELERERDEVRGELRRSRFEVSEEYKAKHEVPFQKEAARAQRIIEQLKVMDPETRQERKATFEDFKQIYQQEYGDAVIAANEKFGPFGQIVLNQYERLKSMEDAAKEALAEEKSNWSKHEETDRAKKVQRNLEMSKLDQRVRQELAEAVEEYHDNPTDEDLVKARNQGYALFDEKPTTFTDMVVKKNHMRHRFAAFEPMKLQITRLRQQLADLQAEVASYKNEPPDPSRRRGSKDAAGQDSNMSWEQAARKELS